MRAPFDHHLPLFPRWLIRLSLAISAVTLLGWLVGGDLLASWLPGLTPMSVLTAVALIVTGIALGQAVRPGGYRPAVVMAAGVVAVCLVKLAQSWGWLPETLSARVSPLAMAPTTALSLLGLGLATLAANTPWPRKHLMVQILALASSIPVFFALAGYAFELRAIVHPAATFPMALSTAVSLATLCVAALGLQPEGGPVSILFRPGAGGHLMRRLVPTLLLLPLVLGWLRLQGERVGWFETGVGVALMSTLMAIIPLAIAWWSAFALDRQESERARADADLRRAYAELQQSDRYKDEFLSVMSHELRTPINFIVGFASFLEDEEAGPMTPTQREYLGKILSGADRLLGMVNNLLDMSRIVAGEFTLHRAPATYDSLVAEALEPLRPLAKDKGQSLTVENRIAGEVCLDGLRIIQVLRNLVDNAIKFTPQGGTIRVAAHRENGRILTEVVDTGIGMAAEDIPYAFTRFKQLDMSSTRAAGGAGLGLSISRSIVEAHGGTIGVDSEQGAGSRFWFSLPAEPPR